MPTRAWNESDPSNNDDASAGAQEIRELKVDIRDRMSLEHLFGLLVGSTDAGMHVWDYKAKAISYQLATTDHFIFATQGITLTLPAIAAANKGKAFAIKVNGTGTVTVAITGADTIDGVAASLSMVGTALGGELAYLISDGVSDWKRYLAYDPRVAFAQSKYIGMKYRNLKITTVGAANDQSVVLTADRVWLPDSTGVTVIHDAVSQACTLSGAGANGLDTGSLVADTGYFIWGISNGTTFAVLASTSATAPSLPAGYTFRELLGWCTTDATGTPFNLEEFTQINDLYYWSVPQKVYDGNLSTTTLAINMAAGGALTYAVVPPSNARSVLGRVRSISGWYLINPVTFADTTAEDNDVVWSAEYLAGGSPGHHAFDIPLVEAQAIYHQHTSTQATKTYVTGFTLKR